MTHLPVIPDDVAAEARHGTWCPKMCTHACPVTAATGRDDAVPWSLHRAVDDLVAGRAGAGEVADRLVACSGCLGCRVPCLFDQDVPGQVRAGRAAVAAAGHPVRGRQEAVAAVAAGRSPYGIAPAAPHDPVGAGLALVVGCRDDEASVTAARRLLEAAGHRVTALSPSGCCGAILRDLGAPGAADAARGRLATAIADADGGVAALDPHCLPELGAVAPDGRPVRHVVEVLAEAAAAGELPLDGPDPPVTGRTVTYHDPCVLARGTGVVEPPRRLLRHAGFEIAEPEQHGRETACAGAGLALELVDVDAADLTAARRGRQLDDTGVPAVTTCSGARRRLRVAGCDVADLLVLLADRLPEPA